MKQTYTDVNAKLQQVVDDIVSIKGRLDNLEKLMHK